MTSRMIEVTNSTEYEPNCIDRLKSINSIYTDRNIELVLCDDKEMRVINYDTRAVDKTTDVLSFPYDTEGIDFVETEHIPLGSIVISIDKARDKSDELGHSMDDELTLLYVHGLLHILGYDHEVDSGEMRAEESKVIAGLNLPKSLIVRTDIV